MAEQARTPTERRSHAGLIRAWLDQHEAEVDALDYGRVEFIFNNGAHPRVRLERAEQLASSVVVPGMDRIA